MSRPIKGMSTLMDDEWLLIVAGESSLKGEGGKEMILLFFSSCFGLCKRETETSLMLFSTLKVPLGLSNVFGEEIFEPIAYAEGH
ncbi:hypothetical protein TNCV_3933341 [Trichonephila clavipes]|nr:hypothetical protein TNCV_3933341 [Trichonephila clavipes]